MNPTAATWLLIVGAGVLGLTAGILFTRLLFDPIFRAHRAANRGRLLRYERSGVYLESDGPCVSDAQKETIDSKLAELKALNREVEVARGLGKQG
jgi:hypothetical protein